MTKQEALEVAPTFREFFNKINEIDKFLVDNCPELKDKIKIVIAFEGHDDYEIFDLEKLTAKLNLEKSPEITGEVVLDLSEYF